MRLSNLALVCVLATGCGLSGSLGSATSEGQLGDWTIKVQTAFALVDATENSPTLENDRWVYKARDKKRFILALDGAAWDPNRDQRFLKPDERELIQYERALNGLFAVTVNDADKLAAGQTYIYDSTSIEPPGGDVAYISNSTVEFGIVESKATDLFPTIKRYGTKTIIRLQFDKVPTKAGEPATGKVEILVSKTNDDPSDAVEGALTFTFSAPLVAEYIGECAMGAIACEPDRPDR